MLSQVLFLALLSLSFGQLPIQIESSIIAISREHVLSGSIKAGNVDGLVVTIMDYQVTRLQINLVMSYGDADLGVVVLINEVEKVWASQYSGDDSLTISASDAKFTDGLGLQRTFVILVAGYTQEAAYTLTVRAEGTSDYSAKSGISLISHIKELQKSPIWTISSYEGDAAADFAKLQNREDSFGWGYLLGIGGVVAVGVWAWRIQKAKKEDDGLKYSLIGS